MTTKTKLINLLLFVLLLGTISQAFAEEASFNFKREISGIDSQWHKIVLPDDIYGDVSQNLSDLRIFGVTAKGDTVEAPFILKTLKDRISREDIPFKLINESRNSNGYFYTFQTSTSETINQIELDFKQDNFDWQVKLEGSHNQQEWFTILNKYRILSLNNKLTDFSFTKLDFPESNYKFYRISVDSKKKPVLTKATLQREVVKKGVNNLRKIKNIDTEQNKQNNTTEIEIELEQPLPVSSVQLEVNPDYDFYRPITIQYLADSLKIDDSWNYNYRKLSSGILNSFEDNDFKFRSRITNKLKIIIRNHDNEPLDIASITVKGNQYELISRFTEPAEYFLYYGSQKISTPNYDLSHFQAKIPENLTELSLGTEEVVEIGDKPKTALFKNKFWLWGIMLGMILLLGFVAVRMIREDS